MRIKKGIILLFVVILPSIVNAQSDISIYIKGGPNYSPMSGVEHDLISWERAKIDRINYSANLGVKYSINKYSSIYLTLEYNPIDLSYGSNGADIQYNLKIFPIAIGYEYNITNNEITNSYLGFGLGLTFLNSEYKYNSDIPNPPVFKENDSGILLVVKYGIDYKLNTSLFLFGEIGYRYTESLIRNGYSEHNDVNISGVTSKIGIGIKL